MRAEEHDRHRLAEQREQRIGGEGDQFAVGEIDQPHDAENQPDAERGQRIEAADADRIGEVWTKCSIMARLPPRACGRRNRRRRSADGF